MPVLSNLPESPYKKFFGRKDSIEKIKQILLEGGTFIASIDGVGGIGKTVLAYYFCEKILIPMETFDYIIWLTAKRTVFDAYSREPMIKDLENEFHGLESLIDTTLSVVGFEDYIDIDPKQKKDFFEEEIIAKERIFFVLDNLENINDESFFKYITEDFNRLSAKNRNFKVLTTSRKRKKIADFPIEIEGLAVEEALSMLKYLANEYKVKDILNAKDHDNIKLLEKVGNIPLGIEFIVGQMSLGKSRGQIYQELEGYPSLDNITDENDKKKRLSEIIIFCFKDMYETLDKKHQLVFQTVAALQKHKMKNDEEISFELLMNITDFSKYELDKILENLEDNKLIKRLSNNEYEMSQMAVNFVGGYYDEFDENEDFVIGLKNALQSRSHVGKLDPSIEKANIYVDDNKYAEAEDVLEKALELPTADERHHYELAKIQVILHKYNKAADNFKRATDLNPRNAKLWYDWVNMEDNRQRYNIALEIISKAMENTNHDLSIVMQKMNIYKYRRDYDKLRCEMDFHLHIYKKDDRQNDCLKLLREWKNIELFLIRDGIDNEYINVVERLIPDEEDMETKVQLLEEELEIIQKGNDQNKIVEIKNKIERLENDIKRSISTRVKQLNQLYGQKRYEEAKKESKMILGWFNENEDIEYFKNALRILLQILAMEKNYTRIIDDFNDYKSIGYKDKECERIYNKALIMSDTEEKNKIIEKINRNIQNFENTLRNIVMWSFSFNEEKLLEFVQSIDKKEWIEQWQRRRRNSLKSDNLIHYSDLSQLVMIFESRKDVISNKSQKDIIDLEKDLERIVSCFREYAIEYRNEAFHSRLYLRQIDELNEIFVETGKLSRNIENLMSCLEISV